MRRFLSCCALLITSLGAAQYTVKYDKLWGGTGFDTFMDVAADSAKNAYAIGSATVLANGTRATKVVKYSPTGAVVWSQAIQIPSQSFERIEQQIRVGAGGEVVASASLADGAGLHVVVARLAPANGAILWQKTLSTTNVVAGPFGLSVVGNKVVTAAPHGTPTRLIVFQLNLGNGNTLWQADAGLLAGGAVVLGDAAGNAFAYSRNDLAATVTKFDSGTGTPVWTKSFPVDFATLTNFELLKPSGVPIVGLGGAANPQVLALSPTDGSTLRTDSTGGRVLDIRASLADTYYLVRDGVPGRCELRGANGLVIDAEQASTAFAHSITDACGQLQRFNTVPIQDGPFDFRLERRMATALQPFRFDGANVDRNVGSSGSDVFMVGQTKVGTNTQARLVRVTQGMTTEPDAFSTPKLKIPVPLNVPAPGVLANDAGWNGANLALAQQAQNGVVVLNQDGSFMYTPNSGFVGQDTFTYVLTRGLDFAGGSVTINVFAIASVGAIPATVIGGEPSVGTVFLTGTNRGAPVTVQLSENATSVTIPSSVVVDFDQQSATFPITTAPVSVDQNCTITAILNGLFKTGQLLVKRAVPESLTLNPTSLVGGQTFVGTVKMTGKAPNGGYTVTLTHSGTEIFMPTGLLIPTTTNTASFNGSTTARSTPVTHVLTATAGGVSKTANLTLNPGGLFAITITPSTVKGGQSAQGKIQTAGLAPFGGTTVNLTVNGSKVTVPSSVTVLEGQQFQAFPVTTLAVSVSGVRTVTATYFSVTKTATITLTP